MKRWRTWMGMRRNAKLYAAAIFGTAFIAGCQSTGPSRIPDKRMSSTFKAPPTVGTETTRSNSKVVLASATVVPATAVQIADDTREGITPNLEPLGSDLQGLNTQSIDLTTALMLTTGKNPQIAFARARIEESLAQMDRAKALKLPSIRAGVNYNKHVRLSCPACQRVCRWSSWKPWRTACPWSPPIWQASPNS